ncbi:MAG: glycoside hydrolase family 3 N-terminal domain-containing protein [Actinomycetota bacterium]
MRRVSTLIAVALLVAACGSSPGPVLTAAATSTPIPEPTATPVPTPTPTPVPTATPTPEPTPTPVPDCLADVPLRTQLGQLMFPLAAPAELALLDQLAAAREVSGVITLGAPTLDQLAGIADMDAAGVPLIVASDEEGGRVQRLAHLFGSVPSAREIAAGTAATAVETFAAYGRELAAAGVGMAIAPVVDVGGGPGIGDRAFSDDPTVVAEYGAAVVEGYRQAGVTPVIKHFPGHGSASADTHLAFATTPPIETLRAVDLLPFQALLGDDVPVLVGHLLVPGLTEDLPTSLSPAAIDGLLRGELGFGGVVITDALGMNAVSDRWDNAEAAVLAISAGADLVVLDDPTLVSPVLDELEAAVAAGTLDAAKVRASVERVLALKGTDPCRLETT